MIDKETILKKMELNKALLDTKRKLAASDYKTLKHSEGLISEADYAPIKAERQALRHEINRILDLIDLIGKEVQNGSA